MTIDDIFELANERLNELGHTSTHSEWSYDVKTLMNLKMDINMNRRSTPEKGCLFSLLKYYLTHKGIFIDALSLFPHKRNEIKKAYDELSETCIKLVDSI